MRLISLRFRHVGPFGETGIALDGLTSGLNVICETNEFGKSTVLKALETLLFKPFSSSDKQVKSLMTGGSDHGPEGEIEFEAGGETYHLTKRFLKRKLCELRDGTGTLIASNREADERLAHLLSPEGHEKGPSGLLWVRQGDSMVGVSDDGQVASRLEGELTTLVGGDRAREYLTRVEADLSENVTGTGREKSNGPLKLARDNLAAAEAALAEAKAKSDRTRDIGVKLAKVRDDMFRLEASFDRDKNAAEITKTRDAMTAAKAYETDLQRLTAEWDRAAQIAERAVEQQAAHIEALTHFNRWTTDIAALEKAQADLSASLASKTKAKTALRVEIEALDAQATEYSQSRHAAEQVANLKARLVAASRDAAHLSALDENYQAMSTRLSDLDDHLNDLPHVKRADISPLQQLDNQTRQLEAEMSSLTTHLYLDLSPDGAGVLTLDGKALNSGPIELTGGQAIEIAGVGQLRGDDNRLQDLKRDLAEAKDAFANRLEALDVSNVIEAHQISDERHDLETERKRINTDMATLAPQGGNALRTDLKTARRVVEELSDTLSDLDLAQDHPATGEDDIRRDLNIARGRLDALDAEISELRETGVATQTKLEGLRNNLAALRLPERDADRMAQADEYTAKKMKAESGARLAKTALEIATSNAPTHSLEFFESRLSRLEQISIQTKARLQDLERECVALQTQRNAAFEGGDAEAQVETLAARCEVERQNLTRLERRVAAQTLLRDTLLASQAKLREAYTEPVRAELAPLLAMVLPGTEANLNESLGADTVSRDGRIEDIGQLSGGTREQIAILTRLAFARLLKRGGADAPVILDDALVYADDRRRDDMFDVLNHVSSGKDGLQLIYLSCHQGATGRLGGHRITPQDWQEN